jgi:hypothetical protein
MNLKSVVHAYSKFIILTLAFIVVMCAWIGLGRPGFDEQPSATDVTLGIGNGGRIMKVFAPSNNGRDAFMITIYDNGRVTYWIYKPEVKPDPVFASSPAIDVPIPSPEIQDILSLRTQWCQNRVWQTRLTTNETYYDIGLDCPNTFAAHHIQMPIRSMPAALTKLIDRVATKF